MYRLIILSSLIALTFFSCSNQKEGFEKYSWLIGNWKTTNGESLYEYWESKNDTLFTGIGYRLYGSDTIVTEKLKIFTRDGTTYYTATISTQNKGRTIRFRMVSNTADSIVFENPNHDFPNRITYLKKGNDKMKTIIVGFQQRRSIGVNMERVQD